MLEIKLCLDIKTIAAYCKKCGRFPGEEYYAYIAADGAQTLAACLFEARGDKVYAVYYEGDGMDHFLFDGILRAGLNYASANGIEKGFIPEPFRDAHREMFEKLNYPPEPELNITNFFSKYKNCPA